MFSTSRFFIISSVPCTVYINPVMAIDGSTAEIMPIPVITVNIPTIMSLLDVLVLYSHCYC